MPTHIIAVTKQTFIPIEAPSREALVVGLQDDNVAGLLVHAADELPNRIHVEIVPDLPAEIVDNAPPALKLALAAEGKVKLLVGPDFTQELRNDGTYSLVREQVS